VSHDFNRDIDLIREQGLAPEVTGPHVAKIPPNLPASSLL